MDGIDAFSFSVVMAGLALFVVGFWLTRRFERRFIDQVMSDDPDLDRGSVRETIRVATTRHKLKKCGEPDVAVWQLRDKWPRYVSWLERTRSMMMTGYLFAFCMSLSWALKVWG